MIEISFKPWRPFYAKKLPLRNWLKKIADASEEAFKSGMSGSSPGPSSPGAYPANRTGALSGSISSRVTANSVTIGTNVFYSIFLRTGTSKMARRKMSDSALEEGMKSARLTKWVEWSRL